MSGFGTPPAPPPVPSGACATQILGPPAPGVQFSRQESEYYQQLYSHVDPDGRGTVDGMSGANFLMQAGLPQDVLRQIWEIADSNEQGYLVREQFFVALRLVAWAQAGVEPRPERAAAEPPALPDFPGVQQRTDASPVGSRAPSIGGNSPQSVLEPIISARLSWRAAED
eukprot:TRINITY_DN9213_c0_g1_i1.p2 TRINITY_DN9213_c0_g1~~TRINITY_DN9213_c0_g1_i1.p2  ORF type:complete len:169 (-),score=31.35 TRINITY_DN9213_c0_g1_i1:78-584(-)